MEIPVCDGGANDVHGDGNVVQAKSLAESPSAIDKLLRGQ